MMTSSATGQEPGHVGPRVGPEPARRVPESPQQVLAPQLLDVVASAGRLLELLVDSRSCRLGGLGLGLSARSASTLHVGGLRFGRRLVGCLLSALASGFLALASSLASVRGLIGARPEL